MTTSTCPRSARFFRFETYDFSEYCKMTNLNNEFELVTIQPDSFYNPEHREAQPEITQQLSVIILVLDYSGISG